MVNGSSQDQELSHILSNARVAQEGCNIQTRTCWNFPEQYNVVLRKLGFCGAREKSELNLITKLKNSLYLKMSRKALVDFSLVKELSDSLRKKNRHFKAKLKRSYNYGAAKKSDEKYEKLRRLLLSGIKKEQSKKRRKNGQKQKSKSRVKKTKQSFNQFDSESTNLTSSDSESSDEDEFESPSNTDIASEKSGEESSTDENSADTNDSENSQTTN